MDIYKAQIEPAGSYGAMTAGEARLLSLTLKLGEVAQNLTGATFETVIPCEDGSNLRIANSAHTILVAASGTLTLALLAAETARIRRGRSVPIMVKATIAGVTIAYWGEIDEVRQPLG